MFERSRPLAARIPAIRSSAAAHIAGGAVTVCPSVEVTTPWVVPYSGKAASNSRTCSKTMPAGWRVVDGALTRAGQAGDIVSAGEFENFELTLDWKIGKGANSGVFYRVVEYPDDTAMWNAAPEYQLIDDTGYPGTLKPTQ